MDTEKLIEQFTAFARNRREEADLYDNAVGVLKGTLETQAIALKATYEDTIETLTAEKEQKEAIIAEKELEIENLKKPKEELTEEAVII